MKQVKLFASARDDIRREKAYYKLGGKIATMPTVLRIGPYRFFFYSNEGEEPPHIHVQHDQNAAKFWLSPVTLASSYGLPAQELSKLSKLVTENRQKLLEAWNEFFGN